MSCENHALIDATVKELKATVTRHGQEIATLKESRAENKILFETIQKELTEIKEILQERAKQLPTLVYSILGMIIGGTITGVILWIVQK